MPLSPPGPLSLVPFVSVQHMMQLVVDLGVERVLADLATYIEQDFPRWQQFDKRRASPRIPAPA